MRSAILILLTIVALGGAFVVYTLLQPSHVSRHAGTSGSDSVTPTPPPATAPAHQGMPVTGGDNVFVESYDKDTGQLASRFRASRYDPQPDGTVHVEHPEAEFFLNSSRDRDETGQPVRQILRLRGDKGDIVVPPSGGSGGGGSEQAMNRAQMPTRGKLQNVNVSLFATTTAKRPTLVCRVNNLSFDNDTFRIATDAITDPSSGRTVDADRVPVYVQGDDYDFEGRGLTIQWDEKGRRLQLLEVARGQVLTIKKPGAFGTTELESSGTRASSRPRAARSRPRATRPRDDDARKVTLAATKPSRDAVPFRATFSDNVVITQGDQQLAVADVMHVDFFGDEGGRDDTPAPATTKRDGSLDAGGPASRPTRQRATTAVAATDPQSAEPEPVPVTVRWTGKLRVTPTPPEVTPPVPGDSVVELSAEGKPVLLNFQGSDVVCASARYHALDDSASIRSSPAVPMIRIKDQRGLSIATPSFDYDGSSRVAVIRGASQADIPLDDIAGDRPSGPSTQPAQTAHVEWSERCTMRLAGGSTRRSLTLQHALIEGDVNIDSPQLAMRSDKLDLTFDSTRTEDDKPATAIRDLAADGDVRAMIRESTDGPATQPQRLDCAKLKVHFAELPDGRSYAERLVAAGSVRATTAESTLTAGHLDATLAPATQPSEPVAAGVGKRAASMPAMQIEKMVALDDVRATGVDGQFAQAEQLTIERGANGAKYKLVGQAVPARVGDARSVMAGPIIEFEPDAGRARVLGGGTLNAVQVATKQNPTTRPMNLTWSAGLEVDTNAKHAEVQGDVVATSTEQDGTTTVARGQRMLLELSDPPAPATSAPATSKTRSGGLGLAMGGGASGMAVGEIRTVTLEGSGKNVEVNSTLAAADGTVERRVNLFAPTLTYDLPAQKLIVPTAGRMLYQDERPPPATKPNEAPAPAAASPLGDTRGATAFEWQKRFTYDSTDRRATMTGDVVVVHQAVGTEAPSYRLNAERVVADMHPPPPTTRPDQKEDQLAGAKLKKLTADGGVTFVSSRLQFNADSIEYDPDKQQLVARGTDRVPATLFDENGLSKAAFDELYYDTKTDRMRLVNPRAAVRK